MRHGRPLVLCLFLIAATGCNVGLPDIWHPGHLFEQQSRATFHDPYAETNVAPDTVGSRPQNYQTPRPKAARSQWFFDQYGQY
ncbi:MAG TPA: membrane or secreted protein [Pirellulaceae bacterium]